MYTMAIDRNSRAWNVPIILSDSATGVTSPVADFYSGSPGTPTAWMAQFKQMIRGLDKDQKASTVQIGGGTKSAAASFTALWSHTSIISDHGIAPVAPASCTSIYRALSLRTGPKVDGRT